jgi:hypothetical protein
MGSKLWVQRPHHAARQDVTAKLLFMRFHCHLWRQHPSALSVHRGSRCGVADRRFGRCAKQFGMQVASWLRRRLFYFHLNAVGVGVGVMANAGDLPGHFSAGLAAGNPEAIAGNLPLKRRFIAGLLRAPAKLFRARSRCLIHRNQSACQFLGSAEGESTAHSWASDCLRRQLSRAAV